MEQLATGGREALVIGDIQAARPLGGNVVVGWVQQDLRSRWKPSFMVC